MSSTSPDDMPALEQSFSSAQQVVNVSSDPWVSSTGLIIRTQESKNFVTFITADSSVNIEDAQRALASVSSTRWSSFVRCALHLQNLLMQSQYWGGLSDHKYKEKTRN
ncbi:hypothetical protein B0H13DRAFT_1897802 [Mycena leptocephala]|nr:hypothetical protein B0H13DRAFT_1897802 [Mycena leptocephala]